MKLKELLTNLDYKIVKGDLEIEINNINYDSRKVETGDLFVCIKGFASDGHKFAISAVEKGSVCILCEDEIECNDNVTVIKVDNSRKALAVLSCNYYDNPSKKMKMIGVTGTNGKTTSAFMVKTILEAEGKKVGLIGTIANYIGSKKIDTERTTPESLELQGLFSDMVKDNCEYCIMEVSSHSLDLYRVYGIEFEVGIFTNLTRDHLDFHKTFENYYNAKYKLFSNSKFKVINVDDPYGIKILEDFKKDGFNNIITVSIKNQSNYKAYDEVFGSKHIDFKLNIDKDKEEFIVGLPGEFNIYNALGAIAATKAINISINSIKKGIKEISVPGRCEMAGKEYNLPYTIILDYAHTPDGLDNILKTARGFTKNRLISVFGCGGDRDKVKRPQMGKIGVDLCDIAIITSDNPRTEDPMAIINDIIDGIDKTNYEVIENRKEAIKRAIEIAEKDDVIVIAGKGHEDYQILNTGKIHFDEREVVKEILDSKK